MTSRDLSSAVKYLAQFETENYKIEVGPSVYSDFATAAEIYLVVNKNTSVVEAEKFLLPDAISVVGAAEAFFETLGEPMSDVIQVNDNKIIH